jgi:endonuclease YncB( thermonuclease family)
MELYNYNAEIIKVIDGDTIKAKIDLGFYMTWETNIRFYGINSDELKSEDPILKESAQKAKAYLETLLKPGDKVKISSRNLDKYKRPIATIYKDGLNVNEQMIVNKHAKPYMI